MLCLQLPHIFFHLFNLDVLTLLYLVELPPEPLYLLLLRLQLCLQPHYLILELLCDVLRQQLGYIQGFLFQLVLLVCEIDKQMLFVIR